MFNIFLRAITFFLLLIRGRYWHTSGKKAKEEKPSLKKTRSFQSYGGWLSTYILEGLIFLQLAGIITLFPFKNVWVEVLGFLLVVMGLTISIVARKELDTNWSHAADYEIKKNHTLIKTGIYHFIRHPIYFGLALSWIGAEMVAGSYLYVSFFALFIAFYIQGKREEKNFLRSHFGAEYKEYMKKTKMLIPFIL
ncbi:MAG TPA: isoprenylcysteine carboxylmethyltransferase family protein [Patescibacteria group bacterium]|nr:isoprenylcysteine carboxylmethyltransferase family protein [Patescibacteria group bacterium]